MILNIYLFFLGTAIGSFLNVLIDRLANEESITGRSHCDYCKHKLTVLDLFPILSFFILGRKCRYCKKVLSWQYPLIELITGIMFVITSKMLFIETQNFAFLYLFFYLGIISCLIVIFVTDLKYQIIADEMQVAFFVFAFGLKIISSIEILSIMSLLLYFINGFLVMLPILLIYLFTRGRGMGFGDVKFAYTIGFLLGLSNGLLSLYIGFIIGAIIGILLIIFGKKKLKSKIAFGPFLVVGILVMIYLEKPIFELVRRIYGF